MDWQWFAAVFCVLAAAGYLAWRATRKECNSCGPKPAEPPVQELKLRRRS
jgi:hypothetical protein